jgi:hypothetical protein
LQKRDSQILVTSAQTIVNGASGILKTIYDGEKEKLETACNSLLACKNEVSFHLKLRRNLNYSNKCSLQQN